MYTNINILGKQDKYNYIVEYIQTDELVGCDYKYLKTEQFHKNDNINTNFDDIILSNSPNGYIKHYNEWYPIGDNYELDYDHLPETYKKSIIRLYFPQHSMESYGYGDKYAITVNTWIAGKPVILNTSIVSRADSLACDTDKIFMNQHYYEYIDFEIIDPASLSYDDSWQDFRCSVCEDVQFGHINLNNTGSILYVTIDPVTKSSDGKYIKSLDFYGGQGNINYLGNNNNLRLNLSHNCYKSYGENEPRFDCNLLFNNAYDGDLELYLQETYLFDPGETYDIKYTIIVGNENNLYAIKEGEYTKETKYSFPICTIVEDNFSNWDGYIEGIYISCSAEIYKNDQSIIDLISNKIPLTKELYKFFVQDSGFNGLHHIELNEIDMNLHNIQAFNKIENNSPQSVTQTQISASAKSNLIQPVFYRSVEASNIIIHKDVTEMICINLDNYKSKVDTFTIQIEGVQTVEYGRTAAGILFKIIGNKLPNKIASGNYYILNQDSEMVTFGKYIYE